MIAGAQSITIDKSFSSDVKINAAILLKNTLGVLLTERDWNPNYPEICDCTLYTFLLAGLMYRIDW